MNNIDLVLWGSTLLSLGVYMGDQLTDVKTQLENGFPGLKLDDKIKAKLELLSAYEEAFRKNIEENVEITSKINDLVNECKKDLDEKRWNHICPKHLRTPAIHPRVKEYVCYGFITLFAGLLLAKLLLSFF